MTDSSPGDRIVVVDGSNIATEGRSTPSLDQLNDAVLAFREEYPKAAITVVVDATFGHRIDKSERKVFDEAVANNELVAPPAGAIGRGDAFVLGIADRVAATILSNDSFQEFHGDFPWLFDTGRLIGGKPVPNIGWVFVDRMPVKGAVSRKARNATKRNATKRSASKRKASKQASEPMPVPTGPPPGAKLPASVDAEPATRRAPGGAINDLLPFLDFVEHHPAGSSVTGVVESYASHGAYVTVGDLRGYVPLRLMGDPPPRSAREVMRLGETVTLVVAAFTPARRNVDLAVPGVAPGIESADATDEAAEAVVAAVAESAAEKTTARKTAAKKSAAKKTTPRKTTAKNASPPRNTAAATKQDA